MDKIVMVSTIILVATVLAARLGKVQRTSLEAYAAVVSLVMVIPLLAVVALKEDPITVEFIGRWDLGRWIVLAPMCPLVYVYCVWFRLWRKRLTGREAGCVALLMTFVVLIGVTVYTKAFVAPMFPYVDDTGKTVQALGPNGRLRGYFILNTLVAYLPLWWVLLPSRREQKKPGDASPSKCG